MDQPAPAGPVLDPSGNLYGTVGWGKYGFGEVFRLEPPGSSGAAWTCVSLHDFQGNDGAFPEPGLAFDKAGNLFGATLGSPEGSPDGNLYELTPTWAGGWSESVLYSFMPIANGYNPNCGPIVGANGRVYGTAAEAGEFGFGVVFELTPPAAANGDWVYAMLYSFSGGSDGSPSHGLTFGRAGALHGSTTSGGNLSCGNGFGCETVYRVVP